MQKLAKVAESMPALQRAGLDPLFERLGCEKEYNSGFVDGGFVGRNVKFGRSGGCVGISPAAASISG